MRMTNWRSVIAAATAALALHCNAEPLIDYFNTCERELQFTDSEYDTAIGPVKSCYDVDQFAAPINSSDPTNDYIGYAQINDKVDLVFACRWVKGTKENQLREQSYETIIHNRQSGKTCFFDAAITDPLVVPLTVRDQGPFPNAKSWWKSPDTIVADKKVCTDCHSSGPYIASPRIVNYLQKYGLINNGHDTTQNDGRLISHIRYQAVGVTFSDYTPIARFNVGLNYFPRISSDVPFNTSTCADACHALNVNNPPDITATFSGTTKVVIPSIHSVQTEIASNASLMPPTQLASSPYRWVNMDTPATDGGEYETLANLRQQYPKFACAPTTPSAPAVVALRAHVVGNSNSFTTVSAALLPDKLRTFNARDGLVCRNEDQADGHTCHDYSIRYFCNSSWTGWINSFRPNPGTAGDLEWGSSKVAVCASPSAIQLSVDPGDGYGALTMVGPADRLAKFDNDGLICLNSDQGPGNTCSNYVVQFQCRTSQPPPTPIVAIRGVTLQARLREDTDFVITDPSAINGWTTSDARERQIFINGVPVSPGQLPLPERTMDGKYHVTITGTTVRPGKNVTWTYW